MRAWATAGASLRRRAACQRFNSRAIGFVRASKDGYVWNLTILDSHEVTDLSTEHRVVNFYDLYTIPVRFLESLLVNRGTKRLRLRSPYREHLSQSFARFFMRVGLPSPVKKAW